MDVSGQHKELHASPSDLEEGLPPYEDVASNDDTRSLIVDPQATPAEVREFLVRALLHRGLGTDHARRIANKWQYGTDRDIYVYPIAVYRDIFGSEDAWNAYMAVKVPKYQAIMRPNTTAGSVAYPNVC